MTHWICSDCEYRNDPRCKKNIEKIKQCIEDTHICLPRYRANQYPEWAYVFLWKEQNGKCKGCGKLFQKPAECGEIKGKDYGIIDHNHYSNRVRGLLCNKCNHLDVLNNIKYNITNDDDEIYVSFLERMFEE